MNINKFLKDIVEGNIKSVKYYRSRDEACEKDSDSHEYHNDDIDYYRSFIVVTLKNDKKYYVVSQSCDCCSTTFGIEEYKDKSKCYCSKD